MAKTLTNNLTTQITEEVQKPINLYIVFLDEATIYLTGYPSDVNFFSWDSTLDEMSSTPQVYTALAISHEDIRTNADSKIDQTTVRLDNVNRLMGSYIASTEFRGRRMIVLRVYQDYLTSYLDYVVLFDGLMDSPVISETQMQVTLKSRIGSLSLYVPRRLYDVACNWKYGSDECDYDRIGTGISGTIIASGTTTIIYPSGAVLGSGVYQADNYWKYGDIEMIVGGATTGEKRRVVASSGLKIFLDYALSSGVVANQTFTIHRGCDKTHTWCSGLSNLINFGGFENVPQSMVIR